MVLLVFGINYKSAPLHVREKLAFDLEALSEICQQIMSEPDIYEAVLVSTCNRTELYVAASSTATVLRWLKKYPIVNPRHLKDFSYHYSGDETVKHLMRVACGIDSMVLGEAEILGQLKTAFAVASQAGSAGKILSRLFQKAFSLAKSVRTETGIGLNPVSIAYAAAKLAEHFYTELARMTVLLIGAGETTELVAKHLYNMGVRKLIIANRTQKNARAIADCFQAEVIMLESLGKYLERADMVVSSTSSPLPLVGKGMVEKALKSRKRRPMVMIDLAVPRDIEPEVSELPDAYLYCVDDLEAIVEENRRLRADAAAQAEQMIGLSSEQFSEWLRTQDALSTLCAFREHYGAIREKMLAAAKRQYQSGKPTEEVLEWLAHSLTNRLLHEPTVYLRRASSDGRQDLLSLTEELFDLKISNERVDTTQT